MLLLLKTLINLVLPDCKIIPLGGHTYILDRMASATGFSDIAPNATVGAGLQPVYFSCMQMQDYPRLMLPSRMQIYVNNLNEKIKKAPLKAALHGLFSSHGRVVDIVAQRGKGRGQAFIVFEDVGAATAALRELQGAPFLDKPMVRTGHVLLLLGECGACFSRAVDSTAVLRASPMHSLCAFAADRLCKN